MNRALITGITGMDGSILAEMLLDRNYEVFGIIRRVSEFNTGRIDHIRDKINLIYGDLSDTSSLEKALEFSRPSLIFHMGAMSQVRTSFDIPQYTIDVTGKGTVNLLEAVRSKNMEKTVRIYNACSSEMFGDVLETPQNEKTPFNPQSPYGGAKVLSYQIAEVYKRSYGMFICNGILFNHEHTRRGLNFVTQKIAKAAVAIARGRQSHIELGNLEAKRDWGWAEDYMEAAYMMLQHNYPDNYVVSTGETHSVKEFLEKAFSLVNLKINKDIVKINPRLQRPAEVNLLLGDASKIMRVLGWEPKVTFDEIVERMVHYWQQKKNF